MNDIWSIVTLAGLAGWVGSTLMFIFKAFPGRGVFEVRPALRWGGVLVVAYSAWIAGMLHA